MLRERIKVTIKDLIANEINSKLYWENDNYTEYFSIVPTSAITGEGMADLLGYIAFFT